MQSPAALQRRVANSSRSKCIIRLKALANEDTLLPTQMFTRLPARATFLADTNFVSGTQIMFLILFRNILRPQQMFPSLRGPRNIMGNNVSATMCPRFCISQIEASTSPPGIPRAFDVLSCPGGREFD